MADFRFFDREPERWQREILRAFTDPKILNLTLKWPIRQPGKSTFMYAKPEQYGPPSPFEMVEIRRENYQIIIDDPFADIAPTSRQPS